MDVSYLQSSDGCWELGTHFRRLLVDCVSMHTNFIHHVISVFEYMYPIYGV